ncbi:MAG: hypothetical protein HY909_18955 [Deltaproteobacteria bacterium]|nr:hypothetical protein [Deltaproteobacteria bacterium]
MASSREAPERWPEPWWKLLGPRYGHVLHSLCSYMGSFPPGLPRYFIEQFTEPGDTVLDPFSGRGTTALEACLAGRVGLGVDLNPLAALLTDVKTDPPSREACLQRLDVLERTYTYAPVGDRCPPEISLLFEERTTLPQLLHLRDNLDATERTDRFLLAALAGILHGHHTRDVENSRCLSVSMPNTFSMAPGYLARYIAREGLRKHPFDAFHKLRARVWFEHAQGLPARRGRGLQGDARRLGAVVPPGSARLIVTSPPYLNVVKYGKYNWIRLWLLGASVQALDASLDVQETDRALGLSDKLPLRAWKTFLRDTLRACAEALTDDGVCVVAIGDVTNAEHGDHALALELWEGVRHAVPLQLRAVITDDVHAGRKVSKIWGEARRGRATRTDRVLVFQREGAPWRAPRHPSPEALLARLKADNGAPLGVDGARKALARRPRRAMCIPTATPEVG